VEDWAKVERAGVRHLTKVTGSAASGGRGGREKGLDVANDRGGAKRLEARRRRPSTLL